MADMGYASMSEITGRADLLQPNGKALHKTENLDLMYVSQMPPAITPEQRAWEPEQPLPHAQTNTLDDELLEMDEVIAAIDGHEHHSIETVVCNTDRATGSRIAGVVAKKHGNRGWKGSLHVRFTGCAGQSFGAFCLGGLDLEVRAKPNPNSKPKPNPTPNSTSTSRCALPLTLSLSLSLTLTLTRPRPRPRGAR